MYIVYIQLVTTALARASEAQKVGVDKYWVQKICHVNLKLRNHTHHIFSCRRTALAESCVDDPPR